MLRIILATAFPSVNDYYVLHCRQVALDQQINLVKVNMLLFGLCEIG
jgi:hypothetical protein